MPEAPPAFRRGVLGHLSEQLGPVSTALPVFRNMFNGYPILSGFVGYTAHELPVRPLRDLLVGLASKIYSVLDVAHIAHGKARYSLFPAKPHRLPRGFVQDVALLAESFALALALFLSSLRCRFDPGLQRSIRLW